MNNERYERTELEIVEFRTEDIIATSWETPFVPKTNDIDLKF